MEPWMGQIGVASALVLLLLLLGRTFIANIDRQVKDAAAAHKAELDRSAVAHKVELDRLMAQHERELRDMRERAQAWEATANRREATVNELVTQNGRLQGANDTAVQLLKALHQATGRELESG